MPDNFIQDAPGEDVWPEIPRAIAQYYASISDAEVKEQTEWGEFAELESSASERSG